MQSDPVDHFHDWPSHPDVLKFQQLPVSVSRRDHRVEALKNYSC